MADRNWLYPLGGLWHKPRKRKPHLCRVGDTWVAAMPKLGTWPVPAVGFHGEGATPVDAFRNGRWWAIPVYRNVSSGILATELIA